MATLGHEWTFTAATAGSSEDQLAIAIAICTRCGQVEGAAVNLDKAIDLSGECPERVRRQESTRSIVG
jgi:hypothetical protein